MNTAEIVQILETIGRILEIQEENPFKIRAYVNGARALESLGTDLRTLIDEKKLGEVPGIGKALEEKITQLVTTGTVQRGYLGMQLAQAFEGNEAIKLGLDRLRGALVEKVFADTPASVAGLRDRDVILQIESVAIKNDTHLINIISNLPPGQRVRLLVWRDRAGGTLEATLGDWAKAQTQTAQ